MKGSITASLGLLSDEEKTMLYHVASSFAGFGVYTCKDVLPSIMKINSINVQNTFGVKVWLVLRV